MSVAVIDTGGANLGSILQALRRCGVQGRLTSSKQIIQEATHVILPGVGAAAAAMNALQAAQLTEVIRALTQPVLGICLGLQLLYEHSDEGNTPCLGLMQGHVQRLRPTGSQRLPHMGWNQIQKHANDPILEGIPPDAWFYFVHTYGASPERAVATAQHGSPFAAIVRRGNVVACQFHPEKSAHAGARILENFLAS